MRGIEKLIEKNVDKKRKWRMIFVKEDERGLGVICSSKQQTSKEIRQILTDLWHIISIKPIMKKYNKIYINIADFEPTDKLVYILLEAAVYYLVTNKGYEVRLGINGFTRNINTQGFVHTVLGKMVQEDIEKDYLEKEFNFSINKWHYRKVIKYDGNLMDTSDMLSDIKTFMRRLKIHEEFKSNFARVITELADNAKEHGRSDCLVDIDITEPDYEKQGNDEEECKGRFYGVNVVIVNFSESKLADEVREKIITHSYKDSERYDSVQKAYKMHQGKFYKNQYTEEDFFNITAFQEKISGRPNEIGGGTGLTELIRGLQEYADGDYCYVLTGNKGIYFKKDLLNFDKDNWIGFNEQNDYISERPNKEAVLRSGAYLPGIGYNFLFAFKESE